MSKGRLGRAAVALAFLVVAGHGPASAQRNKNKNEVDIEAVRDKLAVLTDGKGHYLVAIPMAIDNFVFYGNDKELHLQHLSSGSRDTGKKTASRSFWAPPSNKAHLYYDTGKWSVECEDRVTKLVPVSESKARQILEGAVFKKPLFEREPLYLARDLVGNYYYVDKLRDERDRAAQRQRRQLVKGYRLFIGRKGRMREQTLTDSADDSRGVVLNTRAGALSVDHTTSTMVFSRGKQRTELLYLPVGDNLGVVYQDLGIYNRYGTPCDDM